VMTFFDNDVGLAALDDRLELRLTVLRPGDELFPDRLGHGLELFARRLGELGRNGLDVLLPECPGLLLGTLDRCRRGKVNEIFFKAHGSELSRPRCLGCEDHAVPALEQFVADADAVVGRPVCALRHEQYSEAAFAHSGFLSLRG